jgi:CheY-like chemotaxis protein
MKTYRKRCLAAGCNDYLTNRCQPDELIDLIGSGIVSVAGWENQTEHINHLALFHAAEQIIQIERFGEAGKISKAFLIE